MNELRIKKQRMIKFVALLICLSLIGVTSAQLVSNYLTWTLAVTDPSYQLMFVPGEEPQPITTVEICPFSLRVIKPDLTRWEGEFIFQVTDLPAGATYNDLSLYLPSQGETLLFDISGEAIFSTAIQDVLEFDLSFELSVSVAGSWGFSCILTDTPLPP